MKLTATWDEKFESPFLNSVSIISLLPSSPIDRTTSLISSWEGDVGNDGNWKRAPLNSSFFCKIPQLTLRRSFDGTLIKRCLTDITRPRKGLLPKLTRGVGWKPPTERNSFASSAYTLLRPTGHPPLFHWYRRNHRLRYSIVYTWEWRTQLSLRRGVIGKREEIRRLWRWKPTIHRKSRSLDKIHPLPKHRKGFVFVDF